MTRSVLATLLLGAVLVSGCAGPAAPQALPTSAPTLPPTATATISSVPTSTPTPKATATLKPAPQPVRAKPVLDRRIVVMPDTATSLGPPPGAQVDKRPAVVAAPDQRYALLVGISDYRSPTVDTIGSAASVRLFRSMLLEAGWLPQNVHVLIDRQVTGDAVRAQLRWLADRSKPGTFTLFHYSGHVKQRGGGREALWPVDRDFVDDLVVERLLSRGTGRMWVDIAGCEAGSFAGDLPGDRVLFTGSSKGTEKAYEYPPWGLSVWTGLLLDQGTRRRGADADGDRRVTIGEATRYATYYAQGITLTQKPYGRQTPVTLGDPERGWTLSDPPA